MARRWEPRSVDPASSALRQLGDELYNLRISAGLTQQELADLCGGRWSRSHIGRVENGDVTPSPDFVETMDALLGGGRRLVERLPVLLLETARLRSKGSRRDGGVPEPHRSLATVRDFNERLAATVSLHGDRRSGLPAASASRAARPSR